ncbi:MAG: polysaccharide biosynthesis tyrosine autokinase [Rhodobacteraceae bacterium]|nr:polysaccharide biosynthesis tyrosine autokinase [Paracoccaceae bacterium]
MIPPAPPTGPLSSDADGAEINLLEVFAQVFARKWLVLGAALAGAALGAVVGQLPPDQFEGASVVQIEKRSSGVSLPTEVIGDLLAGSTEAYSSLDTEVHVIRSRLILDPVVQELELDRIVQPALAPVVGALMVRRDLALGQALVPARYARAGETLDLGLLDVPPALMDMSLTLTVLDARRYQLALPDGTVAVGQLGETLSPEPGLRVNVTAFTAAPGRVFTLLRTESYSAVEQLRTGLVVRERGKSGVVDFTYASGDPKRSRDVVNAVVASYQAQNLARRSAEIDQSVAFIEGQLPEVRQNMDAATEALASYRKDQQANELSLGTQQLLDRVVEVETQIEELDFKKDQLAQRLTPNHPDFRALLAERDRLAERLATLRTDLGEVPEAEQELARLTEAVERARQLELQLVNRAEQLRILRASTVGNIRVLEAAETATLVGPNRALPLLLGALLGLVGATLVVLIGNAMRRGIEDARAIEALGLSLFATLSKVRGLRAARAGDPLYALAQSDPRSVAVESLRGLRTGLQFSLSAAGSNSLMITSCAPGDGKSFISLNLAMVCGQSESRVLLIDADMRRGELRRHFGLAKSTPGLSDLLSGKARLEDVVRHDQDTGIDFIATGAFPPNPAELLSAPAFRALIAEASAAYDLVIVDAPPALAVTDPGIIGQHTAMSLLVVSHLVTTQAEILSAQKMLEHSGVRLSGVVLNQLDQSRSRYGARHGYQYGGYQYKYD